MCLVLKLIEVCSWLSWNVFNNNIEHVNIDMWLWFFKYRFNGARRGNCRNKEADAKRCCKSEFREDAPVTFTSHHMGYRIWEKDAPFTFHPPSLPFVPFAELFSRHLSSYLSLSLPLSLPAFSFPVFGTTYVSNKSPSPSSGTPSPSKSFHKWIRIEFNE